MKTDSGQSASIWMATVEMPQGPPLARDEQADVCVIGAGIAGMSAAYMLAREGKSVVVLDDGPIGGGETARTTAHLVNAIDDRYVEIERLHGEEGARRAADSHTAAIERVEAIVREEGIDCDFERLEGFLFVPPGESTEILDRELEAAGRAGLAGVERIARAPLEGYDTGPCLRFPGQGQFHPLKYLAGLARAIRRDGGRIFKAHAEELEGGTPARVGARGGPAVTAGAVIVATNTPVSTLFAIHTKQAPYRTYVIGVRVAAGSIARALYWDTGDPYHYVRLQSEAGGNGGSEVLIVGGEDHKTGQEGDPEERYGRLKTWTRERFPSAGAVAYRWSGQVMEPVDGLAFIGPDPTGDRNVFVATGDSGMGMTHGTIAGILLTDLVLGRESSWATLYDPSRITLRAAAEFTRENLNVALQYADWLTSGDVGSAEEIAPGSGAVIREGLRKVAVYRERDGSLRRLSAVCRHLGCIVAWNPAEETWDCPCHGSRYDARGRVLNGPAIGDLEVLGD